MCGQLQNLTPPTGQKKAPIQAAIGNKVIAREVIATIRTDVPAKMLRQRYIAQEEAA